MFLFGRINYWRPIFPGSLAVGKSLSGRFIDNFLHSGIKSEAEVSVESPLERAENVGRTVDSSFCWHKVLVEKTPVHAHTA